MRCNGRSLTSLTSLTSPTELTPRWARWFVCLTAGTVVPENQRRAEQTTEAEPLAVLQGQGGDRGDQGRADDRADRRAVRRVHGHDVHRHAREETTSGSAWTAKARGGTTC